MPTYYHPNYDNVFIEYLGRRDRLTDVVSIKLGSAQETDKSDPARCVHYKLRGEPKDSEWHFVMWADGGQMLWDIIGETTVILRAYTKEELEALKAEKED